MVASFIKKSFEKLMSVGISKIALGTFLDFITFLHNEIAIFTKSLNTRFLEKGIQFSFTSGGEFPDDLSQYAVVVHCGGCTLNEMEMQNRINRVVSAGVPIVNYGIAIAHMHDILERSVELFPEVYALLEK